MLWLEHTQSDFETAFARLLDAKRDQAQDVDQQVRAIIADVRRHGDQALFTLTARFDVMNIFDEVYQIRNGTGVGVGAPQFGPRRGLFFGLSKSLGPST